MNSLTLSNKFGVSGDSQRHYRVYKKKNLDHSATLSTIPYITIMSNGFGIFTFLNSGDYIMKNLILAFLLVFGFAGLSYAGDCSNGVCFAPVQPVRKAVTITKNIIVAPVRAVASVVTPRNCCETVVATNSCDCGCSARTRDVVKYQPLRRRLVNRSTTVSCGCQ